MILLYTRATTKKYTSSSSVEGFVKDSILNLLAKFRSARLAWSVLYEKHVFNSKTERKEKRKEVNLMKIARRCLDSPACERAEDENKVSGQVRA